MTFWQFLDNNVFWIIIAVLIFGGGSAEVLGSYVNGRRKIKSKSEQLKAAQAENKRLERLLASSMIGRTQIATGEQSGDLAELGRLAHRSLSDANLLLNLLNQVQASDRAYPQLPQELREEIDAALLSFRSRKETS